MPSSSDLGLYFHFSQQAATKKANDNAACFTVHIEAGESYAVATAACG